MNVFRVFTTVAVIAVLSGLTPACHAGEVLVPGNPPLTESLMDLDIAVTELLFDLRLTDEERREYRQLAIEEWKSLSPDQKRDRVKSTGSWAKLPTWNNYKRNERRSLVLPQAFRIWSKVQGGTGPWKLTLYESACKPGGAHNPVLVDGDPPLTQRAVDRYRDYLEIMLDLSVSGGFSTAQREVLKDFLVKDWKKMDLAARQDFCAELDRWSEATASGGEELGKWRRALQPKVLTELRSADNPRSKWLLETYQNERQLVQRMREQMLRDYEKKMSIYRKYGEIGNSDGHFEYNSATKRYDRWVPNR
jgi:hypothetical protein